MRRSAGPAAHPPPWINKYYLLDLQPGTAWCHLVEQGFTVFMVSGGTGHFDGHRIGGPRPARATVVREITGSRRSTWLLHQGTLAMTLAWLAAKGDGRTAL